MQSKLALSGLLLILVVLQGCGFQLRNNLQLSQDLSPVYLSGVDRYSPLYKALRDRLHVSGLRLTTDMQSARTLLSIKDLGESQQVITVDSRGKATEYELTQKIMVNLKKSSGEILAEERLVGVQRNWIEVGKSGLAGRQEFVELKQEMLQALAENTMRTLHFASR